MRTNKAILDPVAYFHFKHPPWAFSLTCYSSCDCGSGYSSEDVDDDDDGTKKRELTDEVDDERDNGSEKKDTREGKRKKTTNLGRTQAKQEKKTKREKSLESLQRGLREVAEKETESFLKLEDLGREMQYQLKMKERDNEMRKEERKHELAIFQLLAQASQPHQEQQRACSFPFGIWCAAPYQNAAGIHYVNYPGASSTSNTSGSYEEDNNGYLNL